VIPTERLFAMPAFEGLREIRRRILEGNQAEFVDVVAAIKVSEADAEALDLEASAALHSMVEECDLDSHVFYRLCIRAVVLRRFPVWVKTMKLGRQVFAAKLEGDDYAIFENAGLLVSPPTEDVVRWWDTIGHEVKLETDLEKMAQARAAEKLTWDTEKQRLLENGIETDPIWVGLDDNTAGYDILSYEPEGTGTVNKLIEVKSTVASPLRFYVTRNEWKQAVKAKDSYFFHVWDMQKNPAILHVRTVEQIEPHIPTDNEKGKWSNAEIPVGL
jgi:Domain of unknown function (DUF3883)